MRRRGLGVGFGVAADLLASGICRWNLVPWQGRRDRRSNRNRTTQGLMTLAPIPVIDLFAGPGGLNEGFSRLGEDAGEPRFSTIGSFEMETSAINTLRLRGLFRTLLRESSIPDSYYQFIRGELRWEDFLQENGIAEALEQSARHVHQVELGSDDDTSDALIASALAAAHVDESSPWVLIGGPPCQAYSLAGRSRRAKDATFATDKKHFLYREYLRIIKTFAPPVFVMENVKGLLSSTSEGGGMFSRIKDDLEKPGGSYTYKIHSLVVDAAPAQLKPSDFVIKAEQYGVPQKRHRVILVGIRDEFFPEGTVLGKLEQISEVSVTSAIGDLPRIRSGISPAKDDSYETWLALRNAISKDTEGKSPRSAPRTRGGLAVPTTKSPQGAFGVWVADANLGHAIQHEARGHMIEDLKRYWFAANRALRDGISPRLSHFPSELQPLHRNASAESKPFEDRFRVQVSSKPATTIVSHISKDGHYYIHPDPSQMRSLTVREAARLQTFPDNYFFWGNRTQQYHQVGNAVPPLLANKIAAVVAQLFSA